MKPLAHRCLDWLLLRSRLALLPVRVRRGLAEGARWSLYPWTAYWRGAHEPAVQARLVALWDWTGRHCWDLGAHYGLFTVGLARRVGPRGSVAAFEPNPLSFARLQLHVRRNQLSWVRLFPQAVSDQAKQERLLDYDGFTGTASHLLYEGETWNDSIPTLPIETCRLDDLVGEGRVTAPDFIKLDVEGHGHKALAGARSAITARRPVVLAGLHSSIEAAGLLEILRPLDYAVEAIDGAPAPTADSMIGRDFLFRPRG